MSDHKDELARALEGLASGQESDAAAEPGQKPAPKARPAAPTAMPGAPRLVAPRPVVPPGATPRLPGVARAPSPPQQKRESGEAPSAKSPSADAPRRPAAPARPSAPAVIETPPEPEPQAAVVPVEEPAFIPAAPFETLGRVNRSASAPHVHLPSLKSLAARRTIIPILLTVGLMLMVSATMRLMVSQDTPLSTLPTWAAPAGYVMGGLLLAVAVINMLQVRSELSRKAAAKARADSAV